MKEKDTMTGRILSKGQKSQNQTKKKKDPQLALKIAKICGKIN